MLCLGFDLQIFIRLGYLIDSLAFIENSLRVKCFFTDTKRMIDSKIEPGAQDRNYHAAQLPHCQSPSAWIKTFFWSLTLFNRKMQRISAKSLFLFVFSNTWQENAANIPKTPRGPCNVNSVQQKPTDFQPLTLCSTN